MHECDYCEDAFEAEEALLEHLRDEHEGELGRIDRRRVAELEGDDRDLPVGPIALGIVIFASAAIVAFTIFGAPGSGNTADADIPAPEQTPTGSAHEHGVMELVVLGDRVDFSQSQYQVGATGNPHFHFEGGNGRVWHAHAEGVTLQYALWTLDIGVTENTLTFRGTTYTDGEGYNVSVRVNGEPVDPTSYVLEGASDSNPEAGDHVRVVVTETGDGT